MFRVGIIGCGRMADTIEDEQLERRKKQPYRGGLVLPYAHAAGYAAVEETEVVAACDIDATRLRAFVDRWKVKSYVDYREMIEKEDLDIVSVATRPEQHAEQMIFAANHGIAGIYAEKPLCMSLRETDAIRAAFEHNQVHLEYGPIYRHWTACEQARVLGEKGALGEIKAVLGFEGKALEGHFIDLLLYLLGDPEPVSIQGAISQLCPVEGDTRGLKFKDTPLLWALIEFDNGTFAHVARTGVGREYELVGSEGSVRILNDGEGVQLRRRNPASAALDVVPVEQMESRSGTVHMIKDLVEAIKTGRPGRSNLRVAMRSQEIGFGLYESHLRGGVTIKPPVPNRDRWVSSW